MKSFINFVIILMLCFFGGTINTIAQDTELKPAQHPTHELEAKKKEAESKKESLEQKAQELSSDLEETQTNLVEIASKIKENEARLNTLDARIGETKKEKTEIEGRLKKDKSSIGDLILALERLNRTPPEAIIARPGAPLETAQSAMLLQGILPDIYARAERLKTDLKRLDELVSNLEVDQNDAKKTMADLELKKADLSLLVKKRKSLYSQTAKGIEDQNKAIRDISAQSKNLQDLVQKLTERRAQEQKERTRVAAIVTPDDNVPESVNTPVPRPTPIPKSGVSQLPVSGMIRVGFKEQNEIGAQSEGLTIESRPNGLVVAPMGGVIRFAGNFKNYGQIIIVEHQKDYHSLIAGLAKIDTVVGQSVVAGEPLGALPKSSGVGGNPTLYYELRLNGEPVNPSRKFSGL